MIGGNNGSQFVQYPFPVNPFMIMMLGKIPEIGMAANAGHVRIILSAYEESQELGQM
jgi:hypothetical protein